MFLKVVVGSSSNRGREGCECVQLDNVVVVVVGVVVVAAGVARKKTNLRGLSGSG